MTFHPNSWASVIRSEMARQAKDLAAERASRARLERLVGRLRETNDNHVNETAESLRQQFGGDL